MLLESSPDYQNKHDKPFASLLTRFGIILLLAVAWISTGCSGISPSAPVESSGSNNSDIKLVVAPSTTTMSAGAQLQFVATMTSTSNTGVEWTASAGTISKSGLFTAPSVKSVTQVTITASNTSNMVSVLASASREKITLPSPRDVLTSSRAEVTVVPLSQLAISNQQLADGTSGMPYNASLTATGGVASNQWQITGGSLPLGLSLDQSTGVISGIPIQTGTYTFTASVTDAGATAAKALNLTVGLSTTGNFDGPAELPRIYIQSSLANTPAPGAVTLVPKGGDLQTALDNANCGDTIQLQADASFTGAFVLRAKSCDEQHWIIIRSSASDSSLPPEGTRMTPCYAGVASLPSRPSFNCSAPSRSLSQIMGKPNMPPISLDSGANYYRLIGLEVTRPIGTGLTETLIGANTTADHIILDRVWFHGTAQDDTARGIYLDGVTNAAIVDSYFSDFHCTSVTGACTDSQAIAGGNGNYPAGPYKIVNNFLEAAAESVMFGGGGATTSIPADIEIRHNHLFKPMAWMPGESGFVGGVSGRPFVVKNHFELKNGVRVLFEGNVLENTWGGFSQSGYSVVLTPRSHVTNGVNVCPTCQVTDVTLRYNTISHVGAGFQLANPLDGTPELQSLAGERYSIHDITVDDINATKYNGDGTLALVLNTWSIDPLNSISMNHITAFPDLHLFYLLNLTSNPQMWGFSFINNLVSTAKYPVWSAGGGSTNCAASDNPKFSLTTCFNSLIFTNNALIAAPPAFGPSTWPSGNLFPADTGTVQFVNFNNGNAGDYQLLSTSPYIDAGTDGKALGADIAAINSAIAGAY